MSILKIRNEDGNITEMLCLRGEDGHTPQKGVDYYTETDKQEIIDDLLDEVDVSTNCATKEYVNASLRGGIVTPAVGMEISELHFIGSEPMNESIDLNVKLAENSPLHQRLGVTETTMSVVFNGSDINSIYPSVNIGKVYTDITTHTPIVGLTQPSLVSYNYDISGTLAEMGVVSMTITQLPENASDNIQIKTVGVYTKTETDLAIEGLRKEFGKSGSGGVSSWNNLTDRPFGTEGRDPIVWDGNTEGLETLNLGGELLYKLSDNPIPLEELPESVISVRKPNGGTTKALVSAEYIGDFGANSGGLMPTGIVYIEGQTSSVFVVMRDYTLDVDIEGNKIYIEFKKGLYVSEKFISLEFPQTVKTLDEKYIPDTIARKADIPEVPTNVSQLSNDAGYITVDDIPEGDSITSWNDLEDKPFGVAETSWALISSALSHNQYVTTILTAIEGKNYKLEVVDGAYKNVLASTIAPCVTAPMMGAKYYTIGLSRTDAVWGDGGVGNTSWNFYTNKTSASDYIFNIYEERETITTLDDKYIPDTIARKTDIPSIPEIPTKISAFENDIGFITADDIPEQPSGVSSWNDLTDKPFDEEPAFDIQWDGDVSGRFCFDLSALGYPKGMYFVKVSDLIPSVENVVGSSYTKSDGEINTIEESYIDYSFPGGYLVDATVFVVHNQSSLNSAFGTPDGYITNGTYLFLYEGNFFISRLTSANKVVKIGEESLDIESITQSVIKNLPIYNGEVIEV